MKTGSLTVSLMTVVTDHMIRRSLLLAAEVGYRSTRVRNPVSVWASTEESCENICAVSEGSARSPPFRKSRRFWRPATEPSILAS